MKHAHTAAIGMLFGAVFGFMAGVMYNAATHTICNVEKVKP